MKKIIVTGCSSGIGYFIAENLIKSGYKVIGLSRNEPKEKYNFDFEKCDVRNFDSVKSFFFNCTYLDMSAVTYLTP